jgi:hypothetical protein
VVSRLSLLSQLPMTRWQKLSTMSKIGNGTRVEICDLVAVLWATHHKHEQTGLLVCRCFCIRVAGERINPVVSSGAAIDLISNGGVTVAAGVVTVKTLEASPVCSW